MRKSLSLVGAKSSVKVEKLYPITDGTYDRNSTSVKDMKTIGIELTKSQAVELATGLLVAAGHYDVVNITGHRKDNRVTITSP